MLATSHADLATSSSPKPGASEGQQTRTALTCAAYAMRLLIYAHLSGALIAAGASAAQAEAEARSTDDRKGGRRGRG